MIIHDHYIEFRHVLSQYRFERSSDEVFSIKYWNCYGDAQLDMPCIVRLLRPMYRSGARQSTNKPEFSVTDKLSSCENRMAKFFVKIMANRRKDSRGCDCGQTKRHA